MLCLKKDQSLLFFHKKLRDPDYLPPPPSSACGLDPQGHLLILNGCGSSNHYIHLLSQQPEETEEPRALTRSRVQSLLGNKPPNLLLYLLSQVKVTLSYLASVDAEKCGLWTLADNEVFVTIRDGA